MEGGATSIGGAASPSGPDFAAVLKDAVNDAASAERLAEEGGVKLTKGEASIHEVMIAQEKAQISLRYAVTLKNHAISAYREIMNTQI